MKSILDVDVSFFENYFDKTEGVLVNLMDWLTDETKKEKVLKIRQLEDKTQIDKIKRTLPAITPSSICLRKEKGSELIKHSGLIQIDIDYKQNQNVINFDKLKDQLKKLPFVAYCGLSVSGRGYWLLIPIEKTDSYSQKRYYEMMFQRFKSYGVTIDKAPTNFASLRGYSYDSDPYFNHNAKPLVLKELPKPKIKRPTLPQHTGKTPNGLRLIRNMVRYAPDGEKHTRLHKASFFAGGMVAGGLISEFDAIQVLESEIRQKQNVESLDDAIKTIHESIEKGKKESISELEDVKKYLQQKGINY